MHETIGKWMRRQALKENQSSRASPQRSKSEPFFFSFLLENKTKQRKKKKRERKGEIKIVGKNACFPLEISGENLHPPGAVAGGGDPQLGHGAGLAVGS